MNEDEKEIAIALAKLDQMIHLFYISLPHEEAKSKGWTINGTQFLTVFENVFITIKENFRRNPESLYPYMILLRDCLNYVLEDSEFWPHQEDRDNFKAILYYYQTKRYNVHPDNNPVNLIEEDGKIKGVVNDEYFDMSKKK